jgi:hypothetical protein
VRHTTRFEQLLSTSEEAAGYFRLVEAGWKIKDLAAAVGRSARHVSTRLALLELPAALRAKVDQGKVALGDAVEVLRLKAHPDALAEVAAAVAAEEVDDVGWAVRQALAGAERAARRGAVIESLAAGGVAVVDHDAYGVPDGVCALGGYRGIDVDPGAHAAELCHAVVVSRDGEQVPACTDAARHGAKGASELKVPRRARVESPGEAERRAEQAALRESARHRGEFLAELLDRRLPKASVVALALEAFVRSANQAPAKAACELLGLKPSADPHGSRAADQLAALAAAGDAQRLRAGLALAFALAEEHLSASWGAIGWAQPLAVAHLGFLDACGYQRSEFEDARLTEAADALERRAAERRPFQEPAPSEAATIPDDGDHEEDPDEAGDGEEAEEAEDVPA